MGGPSAGFLDSSIGLASTRGAWTAPHPFEWQMRESFRRRSVWIRLGTERMRLQLRSQRAPAVRSRDDLSRFFFSFRLSLQRNRTDLLQCDRVENGGRMRTCSSRVNGFHSVSLARQPCPFLNFLLSQQCLLQTAALSVVCHVSS